MKYWPRFWYLFRHPDPGPLWVSGLGLTWNSAYFCFVIYEIVTGGTHWWILTAALFALGIATSVRQLRIDLTARRARKEQA